MTATERGAKIDASDTRRQYTILRQHQARADQGGAQDFPGGRKVQEEPGPKSPGAAVDHAAEANESFSSSSAQRRTQPANPLAAPFTREV